MKLNLTRRDVLKFGAGGAVGVALTPAPWKAVDDLAIWTQNWSWIPRPPKGPESVRNTICALCPAGCPLQARCIGGLPVSMRSAGADSPLCPLGLTGHHLPYHPARIARSFRVIHSGDGIRRIPVPLDTVLSGTTSAIRDAQSASRAVAVLDTRPGRSVSWAWQRLLGGIKGGVYVPAPGREGASFATLQDIAASGDRIAIDTDRVRTIVSFGAPLADGFGSPRLLARIRSGEARLIQIEPVRSHTADVAERWLPARAGSESALAHGLANALMTERAAAIDKSYERFTPDAVAALTGVPADAIVATARELAQNGPAVVISQEGLGRTAEEAIHGLNLMVSDAALVSRADVPPPYEDEALAEGREIESFADGSIGILLVDASAGDVRCPWSVIERKLHPRALVVALTPFFAGTAQNADYVVPVLPWLESVQDLPSTFDSPAPRLAISAAILPARKDAVDPVAFIRDVARATRTDLRGDWNKSEALIRARVASIHKKGEGAVTTIADGSTKALSDFATADELWDALAGGAIWQGAKGSVFRGGRPRPALVAAADPLANKHLRLIVRIPRDVTATAAVSPVMTKLYRESGLRRSNRIAAVNPTTARQIGLASGSKARLETSTGSMPVIVATDSAVMPGIVEMTLGPDGVALGESSGAHERNALDVITPDSNSSWRSVAALLLEA